MEGKIQSLPTPMIRKDRRPIEAQLKRIAPEKNEKTRSSLHLLAHSPLFRVLHRRLQKRIGQNRIFLGAFQIVIEPLAPKHNYPAPKPMKFWCQTKLLFESFCVSHLSTSTVTFHLTSPQ